jgi:cell division protein FtsW (lipid II flippase)
MMRNKETNSALIVEAASEVCLLVASLIALAEVGLDMESIRAENSPRDAGSKMFLLMVLDYDVCALGALCVLFGCGLIYTAAKHPAARGPMLRMLLAFVVGVASFLLQSVLPPPRHLAMDVIPLLCFALALVMAVRSLMRCGKSQNSGGASID